MSASTETQPAPVLDTARQYGLVSRAFHWGMALLFLWQLCSALTRFFFDDTAIQAFFWAGHYPVGVLLFVLVLARGIWGLVNLARRPSHGAGALGLAARLGHLALYLLMIATPALAILRAYGSGRGLSAFGIEIFAPGGARIDWMVEAGGLLHGELGWILFALIAGHVAMALLHERIAGAAVMPRMGIGERAA